MFKALMGGARSSSDGRSTTTSGSKSSRRKTGSKSTSSHRSSRGDDRDRGLGDLSAYPSASSSRRGPSSTADDSVASSYVTAEPGQIDTPSPIIIERAPKRRETDPDSSRPRRRDRDRSESRERERRKSHRSTADGINDDLDRERDRLERRRTQSGDSYVPPITASTPSSAPGAQFATDIAAPGFSQFPMQYDNAMPPSSFAPGHDSSHLPYDPHVHQQFPGQFPTDTAEPYHPPNPAGEAADYYGDQGQSVAEQPGVRPSRPPVIPNSQAHLMTASPSANPPPEPSSFGEVGAAASYFVDEPQPVQVEGRPPSGLESKPPKPSKPSNPSKPSKHSSSSAIPAAAAAGSATYGVGSGMPSYEEPQWTSAPVEYPSSHQQPTAGTSKPPHSYGIETGIGVAAAGAAAGYMLGHHHDHPSSPAHSSQYAYQNYEQSSQAGALPHGFGANQAMTAAGSAGYSHAAHIPGYYPLGTGGLAMQHRHRGPLSKFVNFWRDPEGVGRFEDYTETIGVCKYCFDPGTSSLDAPRKHHYHRRRRHSADRYSSSSSSRVNKLSRYHSSEDERGRRQKSKTSSSWLPGMLAGYAAKSIFTGKGFDESYSIRTGRHSRDRVSSFDGDTISYTSRGVVRRSGRSSPGEYYYNKKDSPRTRSRSRSSSRFGRHSSVKEAALGAAVGSAALAISKSRRWSRSRSPSRIERRKDSSSSSSFVDVSRPAKKSAGLVSFFTSSSENRKRKKQNKRPRSFFSFRSSSSSSLDNDLAFGTGFAKKLKDKKKKGTAGKDEDLNAALLGLGATATALAASSHGRSRSTGRILTRARHSNSASSANDDDEWVDADSEDQSCSSVSSALAFGASSEDSSSDSSGGRWGWILGNKKKKKNKRASATDTALAAGAGALGGAALASVARQRDSRGSNSSGSLQQVYPVPTSDPSRYDVVKMSPSAVSGDQTPLVRPGPIPLQQPQPVTPVSQAVYTTQGSLPGAIPVYSTPAAVPPIFANDYDRYDPQFQGARDAAWSQDIPFIERRQPHRRSNSSPVFSTQDNYVSSLTRRSTTKDQASVSFDLTEEQAERERRLDRRDRRSRDDFRDEPVQLLDREEGLARQDSERGSRRRKEPKDEERDDHREKDSSKWVEAAAVGAIGAAVARSLVSSHKADDDGISEASSRPRDNRQRRRAERRYVSEREAESSIVSKVDSGVAQTVRETETSVKITENQEKRSSRRDPYAPQAHDDYAEFFIPDEVRHSPDEQSRRDSGEPGKKPRIIEVVRPSERQKHDAMNDDTRDLPVFGPEPYENHDQLPWQVPRLNVIEPTPPQSTSGSVRGASSPIAPLDEIPEEEPKERERPSTGSRVSWGPHKTHEYEILSSSEPDFSPPPEDFHRFSVETSEKQKSKDSSSKPDFGDDIEFAATVAAATEAAGFDPAYVIDNPKYHTRTSPPGSEDEGMFSPRAGWTARPDKPHDFVGFVEGEVETPRPDRPRDIEPFVEHVEDKQLHAGPESIFEDTADSSQRRDSITMNQEAFEQLNGNHARDGSHDDDVFSMPGGFDNAAKSNEPPGSHDDTRSAFSAPVARQSETPTKSRKSRQSSDDFDLSRDTASPALEEDAEAGDEKKKRRKRRSKRDSDPFSVDDETISAVTTYEDENKSGRRKHRHRSSRDKDLDDASISSSPAKIDETKEKRCSKDSKDLKDKGSSGFLTNLFGSRASEPAGRSHSRSSSLDKRSSREVVSETGVYDERRRRKRRSSRHRSSSGVGRRDNGGSDRDVDVKGDTNLWESRSKRLEKEEKGRHRYEEIVDSGRRQEFEKVEKPSDYKDENDKSFLWERPELPAAAERDERGASGLEEPVERAAFAAAGLGLSEYLQQRPRSRSTSPPAAERTVDFAPKSLSRPSSPEVSRDKDDSPRNRRSSIARSSTESPTAVPLHFRRPPIPPGLHRSVPSGGSPTTATDSPSSPSQTRHRRLNSVEFRNSREIRPLWLVERHGATKGEPIDDDEPLPSLPSSKTSSRTPSVEDLRTLHDEDAVRSWDAVDLGQSMGGRRRPTGLTISTEQANRDGDGDLLDSQQATPTAEDFGPAKGSAKKEKPKYEFHSPSELLQDPSMYPEIPLSPTMEALPSAEGSVVGVKDSMEEDGQEQPVSEAEMHTPTQERLSFLGEAGPGFAGIVDAAVLAAVKENEKPIAADDKNLPEPAALLQNESIATAKADEESSSPSVPEFGSFADVVNAAVVKEVSSHGKPPADQGLGEPGTAVQEQPPQTFEAVPIETSKDAAPEAIEQPTEPVQEKPAEEAATMSPSKKKKKKKGKKGSASQSVDLTPSEPTLVIEEQAPVAEVAKVDTPSVEPGVAPARVEEETTVQTDATPEPVENSRDFDVNVEPAATSEPVKAAATAWSQPEPAAEVVSAPEPQPEPSARADVLAESEQPADTAALSKKARRDKKKQKKKAKSAAAAEETLQPSDAIAPQETPVRSEEKSVEDAQESKNIPRIDDIVAAEELSIVEGSKEIDTPDTPATLEQDTSMFREARETAESSEPASVEDASKVDDEQVTVEASAPVAPENDLVQAMPADASAASHPLDEPAQSAEDVSSARPSDEAPALEKPEETDEDNFQEAFEEQPVPTEESQPSPSELSHEVRAESLAENEPQESKAGKELEEQPTKKSKKKKNRKSVSFEEPEAQAETKPTPEPQPEQTKEIETEQSALTEVPDTQDSPSGGEALPSEPEQPVQAASEVASEEPVSFREPESVSVPGAEPASTELAGPTEESHEISVSAAEPEPEPEAEVPMTAAQKKKAKKEKKKAKQQSVSSVSEEESPVESLPTETQPKEKVQPSESVPAESKPVKPQSAEEIQSAESQPAGPVEPEAEPEAAATGADAAKEITPSPDDLTADMSGPEKKEACEAGPKQVPEQMASIPAAEPATEEAVFERPQPQPEAPEEAPADGPAAELEAPMTAGQKKKAKKAKKKQQQQRAALDVVADEAEATEATAGPEADPAPEAEPVEINKDVEDAPEPEASAGPSEPTLSTHVESLEPSANLPPVSEENVSPADASPEAEKHELPATEQPKGEASNQDPSVRVPTAVEEAEVPKDTSESGPAEPEVLMTATQKKKAKKEKKKQQKRQSMLGEQPAPESEHAASEEKEAEQTTTTSPNAESATPVEELSSTADDAKTSDNTTAVVEAAPTEIEHEFKAETTPDDVPRPPTTDKKDSAAETHVDVAAMASPEHLATEEAVSESAPVSIPETPETFPEESQAVNTEDASTLQKPLDETDASTEPAPDVTKDQEPTTPVRAEDDGFEQTQELETTPKSKKDKKRKKKRQSLVVEEESQPEPAGEDGPAELASAENVENSAFAMETDVTATTTEPLKPEEPISEAPDTVESPAPSDHAETTTVIEELPKPKEPVTEECPQEAAVAQPAVEAEAAPEPEFEVPMTAAQKKKAKKDKKKRQSLAAAEKSQAEIPRETVNEETQEAAPVENAETSGTSETAESATATEVLPKPQGRAPEESPKDETAPDQPAVEAEAALESKPEIPMTAAQKKKAKKDKKKRKSVSWDDETALVPEQESPAPTGSAEPQDQLAADAPGQESSKTPDDLGGTEIESTVMDIVESMPPEVGEGQPEDTVETVDGSATAAPSADAPAEEMQVPPTDGASADFVAKKPEAEPLAQGPPDEEPEPVAGSKTSPEEQPLVAEEPAETTETTGAAAEVALSAKERRKLKKKEKKSKSVDLTAEAPSTAASQDVEAPQAAEPEATSPEEFQEARAEFIEVAGPDETEASNVAEKDVEPPAIDDNAAVEQKAEEQGTDAAEAPQSTEADTSKTDVEPAVSQELSDSIAQTVQLPRTETVAESEPVPVEETEDPKEQTPESAPEIALSAKERRKLKKKEKKRQSKSLDIDDDTAGSTERPSTVATEPAQDSTLSESAPKEPETAAAPEPSVLENDTQASPDNDTWEFSQPMTAPSPVEDDGKDNQSHDIVPSDAPANDLTSTDEFVSSQVEQPQLESRSSDHPSQYEPERSIEFGDDASGDAQKEADAEPAAPEAEVSIVAGEKPVDVEKEGAATQEHESKDVAVQEEPKPEEGDEAVKEEYPVTEEVSVSEGPVDRVPQPELDEDSSAQQEPAAEEALQPALSKKQKKKDKKKKQKQQEEKVEEVPVEEPVLAVDGEAKQPEAVSPEVTEAKADLEPSQVQESMTAPVVELSPAEQKNDAVDPPESRPTDEIVSPMETMPIDEEPKPVENQAAAAEIEQVETPSLPRKLSKKEKKKQRHALLAQQADAKDEPEEQPLSEPGEGPTIDPTDEPAPTDTPQEKEIADDSVESAARPSDVREVFPEPTPAVTEEEQQAAEPTTVPQSDKVEIEEARQSPEPTEDTAEETKPIELATGQALGEATVEPEEEWPTVSRKKSKKEKKKAGAAAAAALAAEEGKPAEPQTTLDELSNTQGIPEAQNEPPANDGGQRKEEVESERQPESVKEDVADPSEPVSSESVENVNEPPMEVAEAPAEAPEPSSKVEDVTEETAGPEPVTRKLSKKEKRKAKKQPKMVPLDAIASLAEEIPVESVSELVEKPAAEDGLTTGASTEKPGEIVPETEAATQVPPVEPVPESVLEPSANTETATTPQHEQLEAEIPRADVENRKSEAVVSLDPFDVPTPAEEIEQKTSTEQTDPNTDDVPRQDAGPEMTEEHKDETVAKLEARALEKQADLEVAAELFENRPQAQEVVAAPTRKLSKKEKRKAKKKGAWVESPLEQEQETDPEAIAPESKEAEETTPASQNSDSASTAEREVALQPTKVPESVPETFQQTESTPEPQPVAQTGLIPGSEPAVPEPAAEEPEPEPELSRKASKKKAKKAKKDALALDLDPSPEIATETQETVTSPAEKASDEARDVALAEPTKQETKQDDDEWPSIEWELANPDMRESSRERIPEPEPMLAVPETEAIGDFDESAIPDALQEAKQEPREAVEKEPRAALLSKKDKKKAKKNKRKSEQAALTETEESAPEASHKKLELASEVQAEPSLEPSTPKEKEIEPPIRTTTPGGSKIANLFPGLERGGFRRAVPKDSPSLKDSAEEENAADQKIPISEAPPATTETDDAASSNSRMPTQVERGAASTTTDRDAPFEDLATKDRSTGETELRVSGERSIAEKFPSPAHPASQEQSSALFGSSPSTRAEEHSTSQRLLPSQIEVTDESPSGLRRTPSVIHGRHQQTARTWSLEESSLRALRTPSPPRSLFGGSYGEETHSRPRTPLHPIAEQESADAALSGTPRLEVKPEHVLPQPVTPTRKFTDNALARETWPTPENDSGSGSQDSLKKSPVLQTEQGMPVLKPSNSKGKLRRTSRSASGDLQAVSQALDSQPPPSSDLDLLPSSSSYDPITDKGKRPLRKMADVYEGWGETPSSPRSPSRPPSVRHRRSMQHLQDLESRLDQLISENRLLVAARDEAEDRLRNASVARRKSDHALNTRGADLRDKEAEVEQLKSSVEWLQREMGRLTHENEALTASNAALAAAHAAEVSQVRETSTRELNDLRSRHAELSTNMDDQVRQEIETALARKDVELRRLREELEDARDKVKELQQQIAASVHDNALVFRDEDYFDAACQKLCGHVQQWVLRFSKHSDHRRCRSLSDLQDERIADRFDNALLDGSDADAYLVDRVRRRDVFMSVVMTMIWEYIFTRYLFGMDREQRQKLKSLEKQLGEVGPQRAVHRWRATTLTLLSRRPAFASQRQSDTEAVALEIFRTISRVLPPPPQVESQLLDSLRKVLQVAVNLSLEMRTQLAEFIMLPPLQPEYDTNGDLARQVYFNASLMNERSGETSSNEELEAQQAIVRIVLFPLVVKKGNDVGEGDDEVVVCPAQVLVARPDKRMSKMKSGDRMSIDAARSVHSVAPSIAPSTMDMSNMI